jgi:hypothetical protein
MTASKDDLGASMSRRHIMAASMIGTLAGAAGLAGTAAALASEASGQRGHPIARAGHSP